VLKEFRTFISKGNMVEIAIGLLIASAFTGVVTALTKDLINPIIGLIGKADFSSWYLVLRQGASPGPYSTLAEADKAGAVLLKYGDFLSVLINFLITGVVVFFILRSFNRFLSKPKPVEVVEVKASKEELLLTEIRDLLREPAKQ
jgi:large conductance mechanosensitive channel